MGDGICERFRLLFLADRTTLCLEPAAPFAVHVIRRSCPRARRETGLALLLEAVALAQDVAVVQQAVEPR